MGTVTRTALPVGFGGVAAPEHWPRPRSVPRPDLLDTSVESLEGVGPTIARRLGKLGLSTVGDLLWQRPRRYEEPVPTKRICDLFGDEEAVIEGVVRSATSRRRGRLKILTARVADETGEIKATWFNQPWLEAKLVARHGRSHPRSCEPAWLRRVVVRPRRRVGDGRLRACLSGDGGCRAEEAARPPRAGARTGARRRRRASRRIARIRAPADPGGRVVGRASSAVASRSRGRAGEARIRRAPGPQARSPANDRRA